MIPIFVTDSLIETSQLIYSFVPNRLIVGEGGGGGGGGGGPSNCKFWEKYPEVHFICLPFFPALHLPYN